jgi:hypothetical protein
MNALKALLLISVVIVLGGFAVLIVRLNKAEEYSSARFYAQLLAYCGTALGLFATILTANFGEKADNKKKVEQAQRDAVLEQRTRERDDALAEVRQLTRSIQRQSTLTAELDNPVKGSVLRVYFRNGVMPKAVLQVFVSLEKLGAKYQLIAQPMQSGPSGAWQFTVRAGPTAQFADRPWWSVEVYPMPPVCGWDLWMVLHEQPSLTLRDMDGTHVAFAVPTTIEDTIEGFELLVNDWRVLEVKPRERWMNTPETVFGEKGLRSPFYENAARMEIPFSTIDLDHPSVVKLQRISKQLRHN